MRGDDRRFAGLMAGLAGLLAAACASQPQGPAVRIGGASGAAETRALEGWIAEASRVLGSERFRNNLRSLGSGHPAVYFTGSTPPEMGDVDMLAAMIEARPPYRYVPVPVALTGGTQDFTAIGGWTGYADDRGRSLGSMTLGRGHLARWLSADVVQQSCAINTMAHELSHTISTSDIYYNMALTDLDRRLAPEGAPAASYLIGAAAQCTWLQDQGRVPADGFRTCVAVFGVRHFNSLRCDRFGDGQAVAWREDLPEAAQD